MEPTTTPKESIVSRLFGFGKKRAAAPVESETPPAEAGFARTAAGEEMGTETETEEPRITIQEQVIRIKTNRLRGKDEAITAIGDSFKELTSLLGSVSDRLDRQDNRVGDLTDQLKELPEYLRTLPELHQQQNRAITSISDRIAEGNDLARMSAQCLSRLPEVHEEQARAVHQLADRVSEGTGAVREVASAIAKLPEEIRERAAEQESAIRQVAIAQQQTAKVLQIGHNKSLQLFHQATQKTLQTVESNNREQQQQMQAVLDASVANMRRMFWLAGSFVAAAFVALTALLLLR